MSRLLDVMHLKCPLPVLRTRKALRRMGDGERLEVRCTDPMAAIDIPNLVREMGDTLESQRREGDVLVFLIRKSSAGVTP